MAEEAASMAAEAEAGEADWGKPSPRSTVVLEEEAAWMLSLAISKLQTKTHTHTHSTTRRQEGKKGGRIMLIVRVGTKEGKQESKKNKGIENLNQSWECYVLQRDNN